VLQRWTWWPIGFLSAFNGLKDFATDGTVDYFDLMAVTIAQPNETNSHTYAVGIKR
jgi:hypothetical protein